MKFNRYRREQLKMAAKAIGIELIFSEDDDGEEESFIYDRKRPHSKVWNPLKDDAQAFRLAVDLNLKIIISDNNADVSNDDMSTSISVENGDKAKAVREGIVDMAAEIGERIQADEDAEREAEEEDDE